MGSEWLSSESFEARRVSEPWQVGPSADTGQTIEGGNPDDDPDGIVAAVVADEPCDLRAVSALSAGADPRLKGVLRSNPASQSDPSKLAGNQDVMSKQAAVRAARQMALSVITAEQAGEPGPALESLPAAAVQVSFQTANEWFGRGASGSVIGANRCVWLVTVQAEFQPRHGPPPIPGRPPREMHTFDHYTVIYDVASGQYLGLAAGTSAPNLMTGEFFASKEK